MAFPDPCIETAKAGHERAIYAAARAGDGHGMVAYAILQTAAALHDIWHEMDDGLTRLACAVEELRVDEDGISCEMTAFTRPKVSVTLGSTIH